MPLPRALMQSKTQTASSTFWTQVINSIPYNNNLYAQHTSRYLVASYLGYSILEFLTYLKMQSAYCKPCQYYPFGKARIYLFSLQLLGSFRLVAYQPKRWTTLNSKSEAGGLSSSLTSSVMTLVVNILSWLTGRAIISPDTLEKRRHYGMTGSKQTAILVYVRV